MKKNLANKYVGTSKCLQHANYAIIMFQCKGWWWGQGTTPTSIAAYYYDHLVTTLIYGTETLKLEEVTSALLPHEKMKRDDESSAKGLVVAKSKPRRGKSKSRGRGSHRGRSQLKSCAKKDV